MPDATSPTPPMPPAPPPPAPPQPALMFGVDGPTAKKILGLGVVLYLLVVYAQRSAEKELQVNQSDLRIAQANLKKPVPPVEPDPPNENDYGTDQKDLFDKAKKEYDDQKKKFEDKLKDYKKDLAAWAKDDFDRKKDVASLRREVAEGEAKLGNWAHFQYFVKFVAVLMFAFGLLHILFYGSDWERAVALFLLGTAVLQMLG